MIHYGKAKKELLSIRPGLKIVDDFNRYNCTLVAIPATVEEKQAKKEIEGLGFVQDIYS